MLVGNRALLGRDREHRRAADHVVQEVLHGPFRAQRRVRQLLGRDGLEHVVRRVDDPLHHRDAFHDCPLGSEIDSAPLFALRGVRRGSRGVSSAWIGPVSTATKAPPGTVLSWSRSSSFHFGLGRARDVPRAAVVGDDHPVRLQRLEDHERLAVEACERVAAPSAAGAGPSAGAPCCSTTTRSAWPG